MVDVHGGKGTSERVPMAFARGLAAWNVEYRRLVQRLQEADLYPQPVCHDDLDPV